MQLLALVVSSSALPASALPRALEVERCLKAQLQVTPEIQNHKSNIIYIIAYCIPS